MKCVLQVIILFKLKTTGYQNDATDGVPMSFLLIFKAFTRSSSVFFLEFKLVFVCLRIKEHKTQIKRIFLNKFPSWCS